MVLRRTLLSTMLLSLAFLFVQTGVIAQKHAIVKTTKVASTPAKKASPQAAEKTAERKATQTVDKNKELIKAVIEGNLEKVKALLAAPDITINKDTIEAAEKSHTNQKREIYNAIIDKWKTLGQSLLKAVDENDLVGVKEAVEHGAYIYSEKLHGYKELARDDAWNTPLLNAIRNKNDTIATYLINNHAPLNVANKEGKTPLFYAIDGDLLDIVQLLLNKGFDVNSIIDSDQNTAFTYAAREGKEEAVKFLLNVSNLKLDAKDKDGKAAITLAQSKGNRKIVALLQPALNNALLSAIKNNNKNDVESFIAAGADVNAKYKDGWTALIFAAKCNAKDAVELLINKGADVNAEGFGGWTALIFAVQNNAKDVAELLITKGADVNQRGPFVHTPLMFAAQNNAKDVAQLLITKGARIDQKDPYGQTALMFAAQNNAKDVAQLLITKGADVNAKNYDGGTVLMKAAVSNALAVAKLLIDNKADVNVKDIFGRTALKLATSQEMKDLLISHGAKQ